MFSRVNLLAIVALMLGLAAIPFQVIAGIPAMALGYVAIRQIHMDNQVQKGIFPAVLGMFLGAVGCAMTVLGFVFVSFGALWENSARVNCTNNLRFLGRATMAYHDLKGVFPKACQKQPSLPPESRLSWLTNVEYDTLSGKNLSSDRWAFQEEKSWEDDLNRKAGGFRVGAFVCPASGRSSVVSGTFCTNYVGQSGLGKDSPMLPGEHERAGFMGFERSLKRDDISRGTSELLMMIETDCDLGHWITAGRPTLRHLEKTTDCIGPGKAFGGMHSHGANTLMADGASRFVSEKISPVVFEAMFLLNAK